MLPRLVLGIKYKVLSICVSVGQWSHRRQGFGGQAIVNCQLSRSGGFTLIELIVVGALITSLFSTGAFLVTQTTRDRANDAVRARDITEIKKGLELYYADRNCYPQAASFDSILDSGAEWSEAGNVYMKQVPKDPNGDPYSYKTDDVSVTCPQWMILSAEFKNEQKNFESCPIPTYAKNPTCIPDYTAKTGCAASGIVTCGAPDPTATPTGIPLGAPTITLTPTPTQTGILPPTNSPTPSASTPPPTSGLVGYWNMNESAWVNNCSTNTVLDSSGNSNQGKSCPNSTGPTGGVTGRYGNGGSFDGVNDYINIADSANLSPTSAITVSQWVYPTAAGDASNFAASLHKGGLSTATSDPYALFYLPNQKYRFHMAGISSGKDLDTNATIPLNQWTHITGTYDGTTMKIYVNGVLDNSIAAGFSSLYYDQPREVYIGASKFGTSAYSAGYFTGKIDETRIYNRALSPAEVTNLLNNPTGAPASTNTPTPTSTNTPTPTFTPTPTESAPPPTTSGLAGYWNMNESAWVNNCSTGTVLDTSGNSNQGKSCPNSTGPVGGAVGRYGNGGSFDGVNDYVNVANSASLAPTSAITVSQWVYPTAAGDASGFSASLHKGQLSTVASDPYALFYLPNQKYRFHISGVSLGKDLDTVSTIPLNQWTHITGTYDGTTMKIYVNGVLDNSVAAGFSALNNVSTEVFIGASKFGTSAYKYFTGKIDETRIYNNALSPAEVTNLLNNPAGGSSPTNTPTPTPTPSLLVLDADHEGYYIGSQTSQTITGSSIINGRTYYETSTSGGAYNYMVIGQAFGGSDCYDGNANAYPGQTLYFTVDRGDGSFDYDCNSTLTLGSGFSSKYIPVGGLDKCTPNNACGCTDQGYNQITTSNCGSPTTCSLFGTVSCTSNAAQCESGPWPYVCAGGSTSCSNNPVTCR